MSKVKIGIIQFESKIGDVEYNLNKAVEKIKEAGNKGSDIVCLPELFTTGYNLNILGEDISHLSIKYYAQSVEILSKAAKDNKVNLIAPIGEIKKIPGIVYNSALVFDREGNRLGSFSKHHLWALERMYFREGDKFLTFDTDIGKIGIIICYDVGFPEAARSLCLLGAKMIFVPSAWRIQDMDMWDLNLPQRSLENTLFTIGVNRVGKEGDLHLFGKSKICNPRGTVIHELEMDKDIVDVFEINLDDIDTFRTQISYLRDRKPFSYKELCAEDDI